MTPRVGQDEEQGEVPNWLRPFDPSEQWDDEELAPEGWNGLAEHYDNGEDELEFSTEESKWSLLSHRKNSTEVNLRNLTGEQRQQFTESDLTEWEAILKSGAVRVVAAAEAKIVHRRYPDRVLSSRMVRRLKPQEGLNTPPKAKSRWCVHGHQDPDTEFLQVYAPTPQSESVLLFLQILASHKFKLQIADFKNAFCQSHELRRSRGPLYVQPCSGLPLGPDELI